MNDDNKYFHTEYVRAFNGPVSVVLVHGDRLLVDNNLYINNDYVQTLKGEPEDFNCGLILDDNNIIYGSIKYGAILHFRWKGAPEYYKNLPRKIIKHYAPKCRKYDV